MRVALINGPSADGSLFTREGRCTQRASIWSVQWPPVTLAYLAAIAKQADWAVDLYDCPAANITIHRLVGNLQDRPPALCAVAISTPSFHEDMRLAAAIKEAVPATRVAVFGVHATAMDREILHEHQAVDFIIRHEPEATFRELLAVVHDDRAAADVAGLTFRDGREPRRNPDRPYLDDLDALPWPDWSAIDRPRYRLPFSGRRFLCLMPQRGCPYHCSFCTAGTYHGHRLRRRSVADFIAEIEHTRGTYATDDFFVWAETFTLDRAFVLDLCRAMRRETPGIRWTCNSRTDTVDEELLCEMRAAGCWMISFGIESTDPAVLRGVNKNLRDHDPFAAVHLARRAGLKTLGHFILGLPGETRESLRRTMAAARRFDLDQAQFYTAAPFVGSPLYAHAVNAGYLADADLSRFSQDRASLGLPGLPPAAVDRARRRAIRRFYLRPRQILRVLALTRFGLVRQLWFELRRRFGG
jgi:radical SAM superfamily enzyme YgiQ (UPF0313 family)